jgi:ATP-dependent helicase/nuclease subunit A
MLRDHLAVMDLIAAGQTALLPDDDLTLACVLKSPLIGLAEDDLFTLAAGRKGSLAAALNGAGEDWAVKAARRLRSWRQRADVMSPYTFYARILGEEGGRKALLERLGPDAADPIDEFLALALDHERREAPSLLLFLAEVSATDAPIKRDMEAESDGVRVLTVHASKGLEAPIVFLPDTCGAPDGRHDPKLFRLDPVHPNEPPLFAWSRRMAEDCETLAAARAQGRDAEAGEHRRLLYVAMTRAAQRLIVAGYETARGRAEGCWHDLVRTGLSDSMVEAPAPWSAEETILRFGEGLRSDEEDQAGVAPEHGALPGWLSARAAPEIGIEPLRPSEIGVPRIADSGRALEGRLAHALLQTLPDLPAERRAAAARSYLDAQGGGIESARRDRLLTQVLGVLDAPEMAAMFSSGSRSEAPLAGVLRRQGRADLPYSGRIDRLLVADEAVSIVDFKLGRRPERPAAAHVAQLALYREALRSLYPARPVRAALVYLEGAAFAPLGVSELDAALDALEAS